MPISTPLTDERPGLIQAGLAPRGVLPRVGLDVEAAVSLGLVASSIMLHSSKLDIYIYK
jgi:hypothetical protein